MFRDILKKSGVYSVVPIINRGASFLLLPIYTRALSPADYGVMELLDLTSNIVGLILGSRIGQALFYFYFVAKTDKERRSCVSTMYAASIMIGLLCLGIMPATGMLSKFVFGNASYAGYLKLVFASFAVSVVGELNLCYLRARGFAARYVATTVATLALNIILSLVFLLIFHMGVRGVLIAGLVSSGLTTTGLAVAVLMGSGLHLDWTLLRRVVSYSVPVTLSSLSMFLVHYGDRIFLRSYLSLAQIGVYSLAYKFAMMVPNCHQPFLLHWNAQVGKILGRPEGESVYRRSCTYLTAGMVLVGVVLSLFIRPVMALIAAPAFYGAARLVPALVAAYVIRAIGAHLQSVFIAEGRPGLDARVSGVGAAVCIAGYAVLIPWLKLWGAVLATLLGFVTILIYGAYVAQRLRRSALEYGRMLRIGATGCVSVAGYYLVPLAHFWQEIGVGLLFLMGFVGWLFQWGLTAEERHDAKELLRNGIRKFNPWSLAQAA